MAKRRTKGDGGLTQRHDHRDCPPLVDGERPAHRCRGRWQATLRVEMPDGRVTTKYLYGRTQAEAKKKLDAANLEKARGTLVTAASPTLADYLESYMAARRLPPKPLKPTTWNGYQSKIRVNIVPALGRKRLDQLRAPQIEALYNQMRADGAEESSVRQVHAILSVALKAATRQGVLGVNPMPRVQPPGTEKNEREQFTVQQARHVLRSAGDSARWWLALFYGMRQGEVLGLRWEDVDFSARTLTVTQSLSDDYERGGKVFVAPKSKASRRTLPMVPQVEARLRLHWLNDGRPETGIVFANSRGNASDPARDWAEWRKLIDSATVVPFAPLPYIALHAARNTAASLMEEAGIPDRVVAQILGHAQVRITHGYQKADLERMREAFDSAGKMLELE